MVRSSIQDLGDDLRKAKSHIEDLRQRLLRLRSGNLSLARKRFTLFKDVGVGIKEESSQLLQAILDLDPLPDKPSERVEKLVAEASSHPKVNKKTLKRNLIAIYDDSERISPPNSSAMKANDRKKSRRINDICQMGPNAVFCLANSLATSTWLDLPSREFLSLCQCLGASEGLRQPTGAEEYLKELSSEAPLKNSQKYQDYLNGQSNFTFAFKI